MISSSKNRLTKYSTDFGASVSTALAEARMTQADLATVTGSSTAYTNQVITGRKAASQGWVELVADHLGLPPNKKREWLEQANSRRQRSKFELPPYKG